MASVTRALIQITALLFVLIPLTGCKDPGAQSQIRLQWIDGPAVSKLDLLGVAFADDQHAWAVGDIAPGGDGGAMFQTTDSGHSWRAAIRTTEILTSLSFVDPKTGWVAGYAGRVERTTDGGATWQNKRVEREGEILNSVFFLDTRRGWVAGCDGLLLGTTDGGESWQSVNTGTNVDFWCVRFSAPDRGLVVGEDGTILESSDGGQTWIKRESNTTKALMGLAVNGSGIAIVVGAGGTLLRSENGQQWQAIDLGTPTGLNAVAALGKDTFCAVGSRGTIIVSNDKGLTWQSNGSRAGDFTSIDLRGNHGVVVGKHGATCLFEGK